MVKTLAELDADATDQEWEQSWWGDCFLTFGEEAKQISYAHRMGLVNEPREGKWPVYDLGGKSVIDLGGGPVSMLLKTVNSGYSVVVDPCPYPEWVRTRYIAAGIFLDESPAETFVTDYRFDECWIYNVLQHVVYPQAVIGTARKHAKVLRIFEWVETAPCAGHPHTLHADELSRWIGGSGVATVEQINENGAVGLCYYGAFNLA